MRGYVPLAARGWTEIVVFCVGGDVHSDCQFILHLRIEVHEGVPPAQPLLLSQLRQQPGAHRAHLHARAPALQILQHPQRNPHGAHLRGTHWVALRVIPDSSPGLTALLVESAVRFLFLRSQCLLPVGMQLGAVRGNQE